MNQDRVTDIRLKEYQAEKASNAYLMSLVVIMVGLPLPIVNLVATFFFFIGNRKEFYFVRWHCIQAMLSQIMLFCFNTIGFWWTITLLVESKFSIREMIYTGNYLYYLLFVFVFNAVELIITIYSVIVIRKGNNVRWWGYAQLTDVLCKY